MPPAGNHPEDDAEDVDQAILPTEDDVAQPVRPTMVFAVYRGARHCATGRDLDDTAHACS